MRPRVIRVYSENNAYQHAEVLKRNRAKRQHYREVFVEGVRAINQALAARWPITTLVYCSDRPLSRWARQIMTSVGEARRLEVPADLMRRLSDKVDTSELIALVAMPDDSLARIPVAPTLLVTVFDRPASPGNLGTVIRSCEALKSDGLIVTGHGADVYDPAAIRASTGSLFTLPVVRLASHQAIGEWRASLAGTIGHVQIVGASDDGELTIDALDLTRPSIVVFGNEARGLSAGYKQLCDRTVRIPTYGTSASINVACAASIVLYEVDRQRRCAGITAAVPQLPPAATTPA